MLSGTSSDMGEAMIKEQRGNLLGAEADALVNTVNTVGVMGKGIALQFKTRYPEMFETYRREAKAGKLRLGEVSVWRTGHMTGPRFIINFPTKSHWKAGSRLTDIESGLRDLVRVINDLGITSVAVPPLGCGNGGLDWRYVEPKIYEAFSAIPEVEVLLFAPAGAPRAAEMTVAPLSPAMTSGRAALVDIISRYTNQAFAPPGLIESQKLMYFLQVSGEPLRLNFAAHLYGPYADNLRHVLTAIEGRFLSGYGDGSALVQEAEPLTVLPGAVEAANSVLEKQLETRGRVNRVLDLLSGYESAYGLELLATVHWLDAQRPELEDFEFVERVRSWSPRKSRMFTEGHILTALATLRSQGWVSA